MVFMCISGKDFLKKENYYVQYIMYSCLWVLKELQWLCFTNHPKFTQVKELLTAAFVLIPEVSVALGLSLDLK